jgi:hypothetical protein
VRAELEVEVEGNEVEVEIEFKWQIAEPETRPAATTTQSGVTTKTRAASRK